MSCYSSLPDRSPFNFGEIPDAYPAADEPPAGCAKRLHVVRDAKAVLLMIFFLIGTTSCTTGPLDVNEQYLLSATDGKEWNYYRVRVRGQTELGVAEFRQGWYPADAVDSLFGEVAKEDAGRALKTRDALEATVSDALINLRTEYAKELQADPPNPVKVRRLLESERQLRLRLPPLGDEDQYVTMEYDPQKSMMTRRHGDKLIFMLSSDPDQIIQSIEAFTEDQKTQATFLSFTEALKLSAQKGVLLKRARAEIEASNDQGLVRQLKATLAVLEPEEVTKSQVGAQLDALTSIVTQVRRAER